jgi:hypothetical protein
MKRRYNEYGLNWPHGQDWPRRDTTVANADWLRQVVTWLLDMRRTAHRRDDDDNTRGLAKERRHGESDL